RTRNLRTSRRRTGLLRGVAGQGGRHPSEGPRYSRGGEEGQTPSRHDEPYLLVRLLRRRGVPPHTRRNVDEYADQHSTRERAPAPGRGLTSLRAWQSAESASRRTR